MSKIRILSVVLASACAAAPAMAEDDFGALRQLPSAVAPMSEARLAAIEGGGGFCNNSTAGSIIVVNAQCNAVAVSLLGGVVPAVGAVLGLVSAIAP